jgi:transposase, IS5 family
MSLNPGSQYTFFGDHLALEALSQAGDRLEELDRRIDFAPLIDVADKIWRHTRADRDARGRKPWSSEVMVRVLLLKRLYNLSDEQTEYQLRDRLSFLRFAGLGLGSPVPDSRTIWLYNELLAKADGARQLFEAFNAQLEAQGLLVQQGVLVDATIVEVPRQRNNREDNALLKAGETPPSWKKQPRKLAQKDVDARWTKKNHETFYGYKDHVKTAEQTKFIVDYRVTPANVPDGVMLPELIGPADRGARLHADSGYSGRPIAAHLAAQGVTNCIHEKGEANRPLTPEQKIKNREKSRIRARVEHPFAFMQQSLGGIYQRCIGLVRNAHQLGLMHLAYNLCRYVQCQRSTLAPT